MKSKSPSRKMPVMIIGALCAASFLFALCGVGGVWWLLPKRDQPATDGLVKNTDQPKAKDLDVLRDAKHSDLDKPKDIDVVKDKKNDDQSKPKNVDAAKDGKLTDKDSNITDKTPPKDDGPAKDETAPKDVKKTDTGKPKEVNPGKPKDDKKSKDPPPEPKFVAPTHVLGRTFDQWRAEFKSGDPSRREKAMKTIMNFGPDKAYEALPDIVADLKKHNKIDLSVRVNGVVALSTILLNKKNPDSEMVDDAVEIFKVALKDRQVILRTRAVQGVICLGPRTQELMDEIIGVAHDLNTGEVRKEGVLTLTRVAMDANKQVHAKAPGELRKALDDVSAQVRLAALQGLAAIGSAFDQKEKDLTVDKLNAFLKKNTDPHMKLVAHATIMNVTQSIDANHLASIAAALQDKDDAVRLQALQFISAFGAKAQPAMDDVIALSTAATTWQMRKEALATMLAIAHDKMGMHPKVTTVLRNALADSAPEIRQTALNGLTVAKIGMDKQDIKTTVVKLDSHIKTEKEPLLQILAHATIMTLTEKVTKAHIDPMIDFLKHKDDTVRFEALRIIALGGKDAKPYALPAVVELLRDPDLAMVEAAIDALPHLYAFEAMDALKKIADDKKSDPTIVEAARESLQLLEDGLVLEKTKKDKSEK
jgi:hypothetical protein